MTTFEKIGNFPCSVSAYFVSETKLKNTKTAKTRLFYVNTTQKYRVTFDSSKYNASSI
jgi:hypothetical protein